MVLLVLVMRDALIVQQVEQRHETGRHLQYWGQAAVLRKSVFVIPTPIGPAMGDFHHKSVITLDYFT